MFPPSTGGRLGASSSFLVVLLHILSESQITLRSHAYGCTSLLCPSLLYQQVFLLFQLFYPLNCMLYQLFLMLFQHLSFLSTDPVIISLSCSSSFNTHSSLYTYSTYKLCLYQASLSPTTGPSLFSLFLLC